MGYWWGGFFTGVGLTVTAAALLVLQPIGAKLRDCRETTGAYECALEISPVAQPAWVKNGESE